MRTEGCACSPKYCVYVHNAQKWIFIIISDTESRGWKERYNQGIIWSSSFQYYLNKSYKSYDHQTDPIQRPCLQPDVPHLEVEWKEAISHCCLEAQLVNGQVVKPVKSTYVLMMVQNHRAVMVLTAMGSRYWSVLHTNGRAHLESNTPAKQEAEACFHCTRCSVAEALRTH